MGGEQAATVLTTVTRDQRLREGKEVRFFLLLIFMRESSYAFSAS